MTNDDFLDRLRDDWRRPAVDLARMRRLARRRRGLSRLWSWGTAAGALLAAGLVIWFGWTAAAAADPLLAIGAIAFLVTLPLMLLELRAAWREAGLRYDDTPRGVLRETRRQALWSRRQIWGCRSAATILAASAAAAFGLWAAGLEERRFALLLALLWAGVAALLWIWQAWRARTIAARIAYCDRLIEELEGATEAGEADN